MRPVIPGMRKESAGSMDLAWLPSDLISPSRTPPDTTPTSPLSTPSPSRGTSFPKLDEEHIVTKLTSPDISDQENMLVVLRHLTRVYVERRAQLCTPRILHALGSLLLLCDQPAIQTNAAAALVNLSVNPQNKIPIVKSGIVPSLITALLSPHSNTRSHAAAALFSLSIVEENKASIGELGAIPPLVNLVAQTNEVANTCRDAALALYHFTTMCQANVLILIRTAGAAKTLLDVVSVNSQLLEFCRANQIKRRLLVPPPPPAVSQEDIVMSGMVMLVLANMAGCSEGRVVLMNARAVETLLDMLKTLRLDEGCEFDASLTKRKEQCVCVLYRLSKGKTNFRELATAAGAEDVLEEFLGTDDQVNNGSARTREKAGVMIRELQEHQRLRQEIGGGGGGGGGGGSGGDDDDDDSSSVRSDPVLPSRGLSAERRFGSNSSEF